MTKPKKEVPALMRRLMSRRQRAPARMAHAIHREVHTLTEKCKQNPATCGAQLFRSLSSLGLSISKEKHLVSIRYEKPWYYYRQLHIRAVWTMLILDHETPLLMSCFSSEKHVVDGVIRATRELAWRSSLARRFVETSYEERTS
jgi:hypothetical protein